MPTPPRQFPQFFCCRAFHVPHSVIAKSLKMQHTHLRLPAILMNIDSSLLRGSDGRLSAIWLLDYREIPSLIRGLRRHVMASSPYYIILYYFDRSTDEAYIYRWYNANSISISALTAKRTRLRPRAYLRINVLHASTPPRQGILLAKMPIQHRTRPVFTTSPLPAASAPRHYSATAVSRLPRFCIWVIVDIIKTQNWNSYRASFDRADAYLTFPSLMTTMDTFRRAAPLPLRIYLIHF
jgi:hypothetical protein